MHDPRVGRFFAVDPLTAKYPWNSSYAFSENKLIQFVELEGLEGILYTASQNLGYARMHAQGLMTDKELKQINKSIAIGSTYGTAIGLTLGVGIEAFGLEAVVSSLFRGSKFLEKQLATTATINTAVTGGVWVISRIIPGAKHQEFNINQIVEDTFTGFDVADSGTDAIVGVILKKYQIGRIKKLLVKSVIPALFDITYKDGVQIIKWNKKGESVLKDVIGNLITETIDVKISKNDVLSSVRIDSSTQAAILTELIKKGFKKALDNNVAQDKKSENDSENDDLKFNNPMNYDIKN